jgi:hypothetical protein
MDLSSEESLSLCRFYMYSGKNNRASRYDGFQGFFYIP